MTTDETLVFAAMRAAKPDVIEPMEELASVTAIASADAPTPIAAPSHIAAPPRIRRAVAAVLAAAAIVAGVVVTIDLVRTDPRPMTPAERERLAGWCAQAPYVASLGSTDPAAVRTYYTDRLGYALTSAQIAPEAIAAEARIVADEYRRIRDDLAAAQWRLSAVDVDLSADARESAVAIDDFRANACSP